MAAFTISRRENSLDLFKLFSKGSPSQSTSLEGKGIILHPQRKAKETAF